MHKELVISIADLRYVAIACRSCRTKVILDMKEKSEHAKRHGYFAPLDCPHCKERYDSAIRPGIDAMQHAYQSLLELEGQITFRGEATELKPE